MSVEHCGTEQTTPYCAFCGELLDSTKVETLKLKRHLDANVAAAEKRLSETPAEGRLYKRREASLAGWTELRDALVGLME